MRTTRMMMMSLPSSSHPLNVLMSIFGGGDRRGSGSGGGGIDRRVDAAASLMLRLDSRMTWRQWWSWECVWWWATVWLTSYTCTREGEEEEGRQQQCSREMSEIKTDCRAHHSKPIEGAGMSQSRICTRRAQPITLYKHLKMTRMSTVMHCPSFPPSSHPIGPWASFAMLFVTE